MGGGSSRSCSGLTAFPTLQPSSPLEKMAAAHHGWEAPAASAGAVVLLGDFFGGNVDDLLYDVCEQCLRSRAMCFCGNEFLLWEYVFLRVGMCLRGDETKLILGLWRV